MKAVLTAYSKADRTVDEMADGMAEQMVEKRAASKDSWMVDQKV